MQKKQGWGQQYTSTSKKKVKVSPAPKTPKRLSPVKDDEYITPEQFVKLPLSAAITQVITDVKLMVKLGVKINMNLWWEAGDTNKKPCSVCLGGAALCSFAPDKVNGHNILQFSDHVLGISKSKMDQILSTFNNLRRGQVSDAWFSWYTFNILHDNRSKIYEINDRTMEFNGRMGPTMVRRLLSWLAKVSKELENLGY